MISYDSTSIYNRAVSRLQQDPDWKPIINESIISALIKSNSETLAEVARYGEYMFKESKWNTAQNESSILAMANQLGYQPKRKRSATGKIYVSTDPNIHLVGKTMSASNFLNSLTNGNSTLTPYSTDIIIKTTDVVKCSNGVNFIPLNSTTLSSSSPCTTLELIQGIRKSVSIDISTIRSVYTKSTINNYLYIPFRITDCEDGSSIFSKKFLKLIANTNTTSEEYRIVDSLLLSDTIDNDVELYNDMYDNTLFYAKFNNSPYRGSVLDVSSNSSIKNITVEYIETLGSNGNISTLYQNFTLESSGIKLYGINTDYINGGEDEEDSNSIKENATKYYIMNYTVGTKETYEKTILNTEFKVDGYTIKPKKVIVYGGEYEDEETKTKNQVTYVSFISNGLDDLVYDSDRDEDYTKIENVLNYYLSRLKSPQDIVKFAVPSYIPLAVGVNCTLNSSNKAEGISAIQSSIQSYINEQWGPDSDVIDFGNSFLTSNVENDIMKKFTAITSLDLEVEAVQQLNWNNATLSNTIKSKSSTSTTTLNAIRVPFDFNAVFLGNKTRKGFKDMRVGASYSLRLDVIYKKPSALKKGNFNKSIFIGNYTREDKLASGSDDNVSFYAIHDTSELWMNRTTESFEDTNYDNLNYCTALNSDIHQINFSQKVYSDNEYDTLRTKIKSGQIATQDNSLGSLSDYLIYFSGDYDSNSTTIGGGSWVEIGLDSIYTVLQYFATYADSSLQLALASCPLSVLKCATDTSNSTMLESFIEILNNYVTIYVSMRPIDNNLKLISSNLANKIRTNNQKSILYIDSTDENTEVNIEDISSIKYPRMISVNCEYEED